MRGPAGVAGMIVLAVFNLGLWWSARRGWTRLQP
jgi:hypothetical protein